MSTTDSSATAANDTVASPDRTRVGWVGTGVMGQSMCRHLRDAGYSIRVYNRTKSKADGLVEAGAQWATSPRAVAEQSDIVVTMVGYPRDVRETILGVEGVLAGLKPGGIVIDMTTSEPALAREIATRAEEQGCEALDAPVSGGDIGARAAALSIMVGGKAEVLQTALPLFSLMGRTIQHQGPAGCGQHTKMVNQILIASGMVGICEALLYGYRAGLDLETVLKSVSAGAAGSWSLSNLTPRMLSGDFRPGFFVEHLIKDLGIALAESRRMGLLLPGLALAEQLYLATAAAGWERNGTQALLLALARVSNVSWPNGPEPRPPQSTSPAVRHE
ncbi:MAG: NAD(P)-dependent oxidoreductase [Planctomycetaceae bacterium]|nr:NAD(P)-dependent oxidoreductase [Planctomycetaceae bacterium]